MSLNEQYLEKVNVSLNEQHLEKVECFRYLEKARKYETMGAEVSHEG